MSNKLISLTSAELIARGDEEARKEARRRHERRLARGKRPIAAICEFLGEPLPEKVAKKAASAPAPESAPASAPVTPEDDGLMTLEFAKLRALGRELEVKGKSRLTLVERIRAARLAKAKPAPAPSASASPDAAAIAAIATKAALAAVDAWVKANNG